MKKVFFAAILAVFSFAVVSAQDISFGVTAGFLNGTSKAKIGSISNSNSESGFYGGAFAEFSLSDQIRLQPEVLYASVDESDFIQVPVMAKYYATEQLSIQAGPQFNITLEEVPENFTKLGLGLGFGAGYDITENFLAAIRYNFQLNNSYTGDADVSSKTNFLNIGIGYRF